MVAVLADALPLWYEATSATAVRLAPAAMALAGRGNGSSAGQCGAGCVCLKKSCGWRVIHE